MVSNRRKLFFVSLFKRRYLWEDRRRLFISYAQDFGFIGKRQHGLSGLFYLLEDFVLGCCKLYSLMQPSMGDETLRCLALAL